MCIFKKYLYSSSSVTQGKAWTFIEYTDIKAIFGLISKMKSSRVSLGVNSSTLLTRLNQKTLSIAL